MPTFQASLSEELNTEQNYTMNHESWYDLTKRAQILGGGRVSVYDKEKWLGLLNT